MHIFSEQWVFSCLNLVILFVSDDSSEGALDIATLFDHSLLRDAASKIKWEPLNMLFSLCCDLSTTVETNNFWCRMSKLGHVWKALI